MSKKGFFIYVALLVSTISAVAQEQDFNIWTEASVEKTLNKKISLIAVEEFRFSKNATYFDEWHTTIGSNYKINKMFRVRLFYRYSLNNTLKRGYQNSHRLMADGIFNYRFERFIFRYRLRYQIDYVNIDYLSLTGQFLRNQFTLKYNIRKTPLMPYLSYEMYYSLHNIYGNTIERHRFTGGFSYDFTDNFNADIFYRYQATRANYIDAKNTYILGVSAAYKF